MWGHGRSNIFDGPFIYDSTSATAYSSTKFVFLGDKDHNCSFKISQVEQNDSGEYAFRFETYLDQWTGQPSLTLKVVGKFYYLL